jgi:TonB family protein
MSGFEAFVLGYLVNSLWQVPLVGAAAYGCARLVRRLGPQAEQWVWVTSLLVAAVLPACGASGAWMPHGFGIGASTAGSVQVVMGRVTPINGTGLHLAPGIRHGAAIIYLGLMLFFCGRLAWGLAQSERLRRGAERLALTDEWQTAWERCCRVFGVREIEIVSTPRIAGPLTLGFRRRTLLVPSGFMETAFMETAEASDVEAALGHELAHIKRHDFLKNVFYELISLPVSYHPMTRWLKAQIRQSRELVCDAMAAEFVTTREHYARSLLRLASMMLNQTQTVNIHAIGIFDANILERRVMNLMTKPRETRGLLRVGFAAVCVLVGVATCGSALALRLDMNEPPPVAAAPAANDAARTVPDMAIITPDAAPAANGPVSMEHPVPDMAVITPDGAPGANGPVSIAAGVVAGNKIGGENPKYPAEARAAKVSGTVVLRAIISKTGAIANLQVISGPKELRASAVDAVRTWHYKPYLLNGEPTAVETTINVNYNLEG